MYTELLKNNVRFDPKDLRFVDEGEIIELKRDDGFSDYFRCVGPGTFEKVEDWPHSHIRQHISKIMKPFVLNCIQN